MWSWKLLPLPIILPTSTYNTYLQYPASDANSAFGNSVSSAGDVNGDGYDDLVVGASHSDLKATNAGAAFIYYGGPSMQTTSTYDVYLEYASTDGETGAGNFGNSVSSAGDVNGDGYDDVVVGAHSSDLKASGAGAAFIYHGGPSMQTTSTYNIYLEYASTDTGALFGESVSSAGDVNGDGYDDVVVGAVYSEIKAIAVGAAFIFHGGPSMQTTSTYNIYLEYPRSDTFSDFGRSVSSAGDVNGDGYDDLVVGAPRSDLKISDAGAAFIFHGGPSMLTTSTYNVYLEYASTDGSIFGNFGYSVSSAGDVNGDGYDDIVVGVHRSNLKAYDAGAAFIYHGGPSMDTTSTYNIYLEYASTDANAYFGYSVSSAGDINGDGYDDVVVGANSSDLKAPSAGAAFIYYGGSSMQTTSTYDVYNVASGLSVSSAGDVNGDGYDDIIIGRAGAFIYWSGRNMDTTSTYEHYFEYPFPGGGSFGKSVSSAGDVNGDGYDDLIVGAPGSSIKGVAAGAAFIYHGGPSLSTTSTYNIYLEYASTDDYARFGYSVMT